MDFAAALADLNTQLGDTDNFTYTIEEKTRALTEAFNDPYAVSTVWDTSLTYITGTYQYAKPAGVDVVQDIYIKDDNSQDQPEKISSSLYEVVGTNIQFKPGADVIPQGYTLYIKGKTKITIASTINDTDVYEYVLTVAQFRCLKLLGNKKVNRFLKNDTTLSELITLKRDLQQDITDYRKHLPTGFQVA